MSLVRVQSVHPDTIMNIKKENLIKQDKVNGKIVHGMTFHDEEYSVKYDPENGLLIPQVYVSIRYDEWGNAFDNLSIYYIQIKNEVLKEMLEGVKDE